MATLTKRSESFGSNHPTTMSKSKDISSSVSRGFDKTFLQAKLSSFYAHARPWTTDFCDVSCLALPNTTTSVKRVTTNIGHFYGNYLVILTGIMLVAIVSQPISFLTIALVSAFLYFALQKHQDRLVSEIKRYAPADRVGFEVNSSHLFTLLLITVAITLLVQAGGAIFTAIGYWTSAVLTHAFCYVKYCPIEPQGAQPLDNEAADSEEGDDYEA
mmetsp:Transcript_36403/g.41511  ORF Transcript_36403/g.41511 Transcript_36403/m.41511 type:complete len:215 (-) Transcript_36403:137-781(-)